MKILDEYMVLKKKYINYIIIIKVGSFYHVYTDDVYILNYFFNYKIFEYSTTLKIGFPINNIDKIIDSLNIEKFNYIVVNNDIKTITNNRMTKHKYQKLINKAQERYNIKSRIEKIYIKLNDLISDVKINKIIESIEKLL